VRGLFIRGPEFETQSTLNAFICVPVYIWEQDLFAKCWSFESGGRGVLFEELMAEGHMSKFLLLSSQDVTASVV
jgi:hypothetical protein